MLHEHHQGSGSLECEGGREREETLEGTRQSGNKKQFIFKINVLCNAVPVEVQPPSDAQVWYTKNRQYDNDSRTVTGSLTEYGVGYLDNTWNKLVLNYSWTSENIMNDEKQFELHLLRMENLHLRKFWEDKCQMSLIPKSIQVWNLMLSHVPFFFVQYTHLFSIQKLKHNYLWQKPSGMHHRRKSWAPSKTGLCRKKAVARNHQTNFHM